MNKLTLTTCIAVAGAASAFAGPMAMEKNVAPVAAACTWTGFYVGVNAGASQFQSRITNVNNWNPDAETEGNNFATTTFSNTAFSGGGQVGYNYQWRDLVLGVEADFSGLAGADNHTVMTWADESGGHENLGWDMKAKIDYMGTIRGKMGISFLDNKAMIYGTAGGAYAHGTWDAYSFYYPVDESNLYDVGWRGEDWRWGWVAGMGFEYALNCHWSIRGEGLWTWFQQDTEHSNEGGSYYADYPAKIRFEDDLFTARIGLNYKFTGFGGH